MPLELTKGQKDILAAGGHLLVKGGPGSGKTTVSILKAGRMVAAMRPGQRVLFLSFARATVARVLEAIAEEATLSREERNSIEVDTYHSQFWHLLKTHGYLLGWPRRLSVLPPPSQAAAVADITSDYKALSGLTDAEKAERGARIEAELLRLARQEGRVCFDLFAPSVADLLEASSKLRALVASKYPVIVLDEFQDTNPDQWRVVKALGEHCTLIALADPEQRIFDFIGADPERLQHFIDAFAPTEFDLAGDNHRSKGTDIAVFGNDILKGTFSKSNYEGIAFEMFSSVDILSMNKLRAETLAARNRLAATGKLNWSMAILVPTKKLTRMVSDAFRQSAGNLPAIPHDASVEMDAAILGAEVIACLLQPRTGGEAHRQAFVGLVDEYYRGKSGAEASASNIKTGAAIRKAYEKLLALEAAGKAVPQNSIMVNMMAVYEATGEVVLTGDPDTDWTSIRDILEAGACLRLRDIGAETRNVRLLGRGTQLRQALAQDWRSFGGYRNAVSIVRNAFVQQHFSNTVRLERGVSVMNMHKAKGKQFDEVIIFEGFPRKAQGNIVSNSDRFVRQNLRANIGSDTRQNFRVSVTRAKMRTTILTPQDDPCVLLVPE